LFNLIVAGTGWKDHRDTFTAGRVFEYTEEIILKRFMSGGVPDTDEVCKLPTVFMSENDGEGSQWARIGTLNSIRRVGNEYHLEYAYDDSLPPMPNSSIMRMAGELHIQDFEFQRTHWAIKDVDLYRVLFRDSRDAKPKPKVFLLDPVDTDATLVSVMMPFDTVFDGVYAALSGATEDCSMWCQRADDIWDHDAIIQDIVSLINRSGVVICDLTGKNANVFYEAGIAHCLGKDVILITQSPDDVPFDLRHLRYIHYLNNGEGLRELQEKVLARLKTLIGHHAR